MNLLKCDKCGNRNVMCSLCEKNRLYRETEYSHNNFIRNKAVDEFVEKIDKHVFEKKTEEQYSNSVSFMREIKQIAEQMKAGVENERDII